MIKLIFSYSFVFVCLLFQNLFSAEFKGDFQQGSFIIGKTNPDSKITIDNKCKAYFFIIS